MFRLPLRRRPMIMGIAFLACLLVYLYFWTEPLDIMERFKGDLTQVKWSHATNSLSQLREVLDDPSIHMIEADVSLGNLETNLTKIIPIMAHPPKKVSDLSLQKFLDIVTEFNRDIPMGKRKGIKLDFKSINAVEPSFEILILHEYDWDIFTSFPVWINADILRGPGSDKGGLEPELFMDLFTDFFRGEVEVVLSAGWTTKFDPRNPAEYDKPHVDAMLRLMEKWRYRTWNSIREHKVTFPVRAAQVAFSEAALASLLDTWVYTESPTLTIWSAESDLVDYDRLAEVINNIGKDKIFLDIPSDQEIELRKKI